LLFVVHGRNERIIDVASAESGTTQRFSARLIAANSPGNFHALNRLPLTTICFLLFRGPLCAL
jgi:hypothetical protein